MNGDASVAPAHVHAIVQRNPPEVDDVPDCLIGPVLTLLTQGASEDDIALYLHGEIDEHFGLSPECYDFAEVARLLRRWFDQGWRSLDEPVAIFVALLDEGTDVWRPVQARPLEHGIIGVYADTSDETWQSCEGAIVKCVNRTFADGESGIVAIEQVEGIE